MDLPRWAEWKSPDGDPYTIGVEEELMLVDAEDHSLVNRIEAVLPRLPENVARQTSQEVHGSVVEICTPVRSRVADADAELRRLRTAIADTLATLGMRGAGAGTHPFATWEEISVTGGERYEYVHGSLRALARREPTFALHVHIGLPGPETAIRVHNRMRVHLPLLLALSANSPFWQGRDTGLASARTPLFQAFPRVGIPRAFRDYTHYAEEVDLLIRTEAVPDRSYLWWDIRPQPAIGTVEIRSMDCQTRADDAAALVALTQCLVKAEAEDTIATARAIDARETLDENRFIAARDGVEARLIDPDLERRVPVREILGGLVVRCREHAAELGCEAELERVSELLDDPPAGRQREVAAEVPSLAGVVRHLADELA
jgi:carboxylate-amine ligase